MIIHQPEISTANGKVKVSARIELKRVIPQFPTSIWFTFLEEHEPWISERSDGFVIGALNMAMYFNEALEVRGAVSPLLAYNLEEYQRIFNYWVPDKLNLIDVNYQNLRGPSPPKKLEAVGLSFSGGVDSLFSLYHHLPQNQPVPSARVTHLLFNQGFNRSDKDEASYQAALEKFYVLGKRHGLTVIPANTNARDLSEPWLDYEIAQSSTLLGTPLILSNLFAKFIVSASFTYAEIKRHNPNSPFVVPLCSTETMEMIQYGASTDRMRKVAAIGSWEETQINLRSCLNPQGLYGVYNCSSCEKCLRTMIQLKMTGDLKNIQTFRQPFRYWEILRLGLHFNPEFPIYWLFSYAFKEKKYQFIPPLVAVICIGWLKDSASKFIPGFIKHPLKMLIYPHRRKENLQKERLQK